MFEWREKDDPDRVGYTVWSPFMINYRVANLSELLEELRKEGVQIVGGMEEYEYGKFAWIIDPDGNKIELWEPPA